MSINYWSPTKRQQSLLGCKDRIAHYIGPCASGKTEVLFALPFYNDMKGRGVLILNSNFNQLDERARLTAHNFRLAYSQLKQELFNDDFKLHLMMTGGRELMALAQLDYIGIDNAADMELRQLDLFSVRLKEHGIMRLASNSHVASEAKYV